MDAAHKATRDEVKIEWPTNVEKEARKAHIIWSLGT